MDSRNILPSKWEMVLGLSFGMILGVGTSL